ncbi:MAG: hypothetical protein EOP14_00690 [Pseudomonas sp.]|nr:MAG: hypothetical protein EOP14_00690 [Pseudomonas sp.]
MSAAVPAQQMSYGEFVQAAMATQLLNHGRNWEIFLHGCSLGFADGSLEAALAQVHEREVNNALYANSPDAPEWIKADMPSAVVLAEYPQVTARFPGMLAKVSSQQAADPRNVPLDHQQFNAYIEQCFSEMDASLRDLVVCPAGHAWKQAERALRWNAGDPLRSTLNGASFFIGRTLANEQDVHQFGIEVRYFWQRRTLQRNGRTEAFGDDQHRVTLWVSQGRPFAGMSKSLLDQSASFFYADDVPALAIQVAAAIRTALSRSVCTGVESTPSLA